MLQNLSAVELEPINSTKTSASPATQSARDTHQDSQGSNNRVGGAAEANTSSDEPDDDPFLKRGRSIVVIMILTLVLILNSVSTGFLTVGIPRMAADLKLPNNLLLWPQSVFGLTTGSCLLLAGSVADVVGSRVVNLAGTFVVGIFIMACGFSRTGIQLIMFRAIQGIGLSLFLPTGMAILSTSIPNGTRRNIAFSCLGGGQVLGYAIGLVLSGLFIDTIGWRAGWYMSGAVTLVLFLISIWALPADRGSDAPILRQLSRNIDWVGAVMASTLLAFLSYVLA